MTKNPKTSKDAADKVIKNIRRKTRQTYSSKEKIRIVLAGLRGEENISVLCRRGAMWERQRVHHNQPNQRHRLRSPSGNPPSVFCRMKSGPGE